MRVRSRIRDYKDYARPVVGGGVVNTNRDEWLKAQKRLEHSEKQQNLERKVNSLEEKVDLILDLLQKRFTDE